MRLSLYLIASTVIILSTLNGRVGAIATEAEQFCFLTTASGKVIDLSNAFCHSQQSQISSTKKDEAFVEEYKNQAMKYDDLRDNLIGNIESSAQEKIERAKGVCADLKAGISLDEIAEDLYKDSTRASRINALIINSLAIKIYCPSMDK